MVDERNPRDEFGNKERQKTKKGMNGKDEEGRAGKKAGKKGMGNRRKQGSRSELGKNSIKQLIN